MPPEVEHVWTWFWKLHEGRQGNGWDSLPFSWTDLHHFFSLYRLNPSPWEIQIIRAFDRAFRNATATKPEEPKK